MESTCWGDSGLWKLKVLIANLPMVKCRLPHLFLFRALQFQVRLEQGTLTGIGPSGMNTPEQCRRLSNRQEKHC